MPKIKLSILILILFIFITSHSAALAEVSTKSATPTATSSSDKKAAELKEQLKTYVARREIIKKRGVMGTILEVNNHQMTLTDIKGNKRFIDVDELTKFSDLTGKQAGLSDFKSQDRISVIGLYNTESRRLLARFIKVEGNAERLFGEVTDIDSKNASIEILNEDSRDTKVIDIETITKTQSYAQKEGLVKSGFSKILIGEKISIFGFSKETNKLTAGRILLLPELSPNIKPSPTPSLTPTPTKKITPTPTMKKTTTPKLTTAPLP